MRKLAQYKLECPAEEILGQKLYAPIPIANSKLLRCHTRM